MSTAARRLAWAGVLLVVVVSLAVGVTGERSPRTEADRVDRLSSLVRCPTCRGLSAAESDAKAAQAVRDEIRQRVRDGESDEEVLGFLASRYGRDILLVPDAGGVAGLVWALPVAALLIAAAALVAGFRARRSNAPSEELGRGFRNLFPRRTVAVASVVVVAAGAGWAMAAAAGQRLAGEPASGSIPETGTDRILRAQALVGQGKILDAVKLYEEVLRDDPDNPVALAHKGWLVSRVDPGLVDDGLAGIDKAIELQPDYAEAHFFRGMILWKSKGDAVAGAESFQRAIDARPPRGLVATLTEARDQARSEGPQAAS